jgi:hypothetical protein
MLAAGFAADEQPLAMSTPATSTHNLGRQPTDGRAVIILDPPEPVASKPCSEVS